MSLWPLHAGLREVDGVERGRATDEEAVALGAAEAHVRHRLRHLDLAEERAVGRVAVHALASAGPHVTVGVEAEAVEQAGAAGRKHLATRELGAGADAEAADVPRPIRIVRSAGVGDVEQAL